MWPAGASRWEGRREGGVALSLPHPRRPSAPAPGLGRPSRQLSAPGPRPSPVPPAPGPPFPDTFSCRWPEACNDFRAWGHLGDATGLSEPRGPRPGRGAVGAGLGPLGGEGGGREPRTRRGASDSPGPRRRRPLPSRRCRSAALSFSLPEGRCLPRPLRSPRPPPHVTPVLSLAATRAPEGPPAVPGRVAGQGTRAAWWRLVPAWVPASWRCREALPCPRAAHGLGCSVPEVSPPKQAHLEVRRPRQGARGRGGLKVTAQSWPWRPRCASRWAGGVTALEFLHGSSLLTFRLRAENNYSL